MVKAKGKGKARASGSKPKKKAALENTSAETAASEPVNVNVEEPATVSGGEEKAEENKKEGQNGKEKVDSTLVTTGENSRKRKRKNATVGAADVMRMKEKDNPETSTKVKDTKKSDSMGMIFMCSSKTKQDCYRYKVLGLPAAKKDMVAKIYKGMRLFLFDIDLKLLYGIYKAAAPGGYNIEPKAFKSAFPSQVRFSVMDDCLPLSEEKFKAVIKDNYYGKNKFDCQLKAEQVKNLCKLFKVSARGHELKPDSKDRKTEAPRHVDRSRDRQQERDRDRHQERDRERQQERDREKRQGRDREKRQGQDREKRQRRDRETERHPSFGGDRRLSEADSSRYERELVAPPLLHPPRPPTYPYERQLDSDYHRRDVQDERHVRRLLDSDLNRREEIAYRNPYEPPLSYREPLYTRAPPLALEVPLPSHQPLYTSATAPTLELPPLSYHEPLYTRAPPSVHELASSYHEPLYTRAPPPVHQVANSYLEPLYTRALPAHEQPLSYHESLYTRAPLPSYHPSSMYRH
ncbi:hypothetical protein AQUCO_00300084v1 [Aquilegia coerulea]|uniref:DCD domain-containing protein n=1 Tax=Aquilegia coerulea TaxID=218851 RepID=A0A2G5EXF0_AQUCA|nr:hypothetical protein AQUCO_00300084v1 [Aquilegia coerulea]